MDDFSLDRLTMTTCSGSTRDSSPFITREMASNVQKLTPSCLSSPKRIISPTGTPLNSPSRSRSVSVDRRPSSLHDAHLLPADPKVEEGGIVASFFSRYVSHKYVSSKLIEEG